MTFSSVHDGRGGTGGSAVSGGGGIGGGGGCGSRVLWILLASSSAGDSVADGAEHLPVIPFLAQHLGRFDKCVGSSRWVFLGWRSCKASFCHL